MANRGRRRVRASFLGTHRVAANAPPFSVRPGAAPERAFCRLIVTVSVAISPVNGVQQRYTKGSCNGAGFVRGNR